VHNETLSDKGTPRDNTHHLTTNWSESSGFGDGPSMGRPTSASHQRDNSTFKKFKSGAAAEESKQQSFKLEPEPSDEALL